MPTYQRDNTIRRYPLNGILGFKSKFSFHQSPTVLFSLLGVHTSIVYTATASQKKTLTVSRRGWWPKRNLVYVSGLSNHWCLQTLCNESWFVFQSKSFQVYFKVRRRLLQAKSLAKPAMKRERIRKYLSPEQNLTTEIWRVAISWIG